MHLFVSDIKAVAGRAEKSTDAATNAELRGLLPVVSVETPLQLWDQVWVINLSNNLGFSLLF
jgi:hypothetical protein